MALIKYNNNSIANITSAGQLASGSLVPISEQTASASASIEFTTGIDSTYPIYKFEFINIHPATDNVYFQINFSTDGGSNYNVTKTTTFFTAHHNENDSEAQLVYQGNLDLAQSTGFKSISNGIGNENNQSGSGYLQLFNPSSTTFVKHFISQMSIDEYRSWLHVGHTAGYGNTTSSIDAVKFQMSSGNIDSGTIKLYGIKDS